MTTTEPGTTDTGTTDTGTTDPGTTTSTASAALVTAPALTVMTYNVKNWHPQPEHAWADRLPLVARIVHRNDPDVLAVQEAFPEQMADLSSVLPGYTAIGQGREGGSAGEHAAVLVRDSRLEVLASGDFWLSDTPDVVASNTWGTSHLRMATWVRLRDRATGIVFTLLNTHVDHADGPRGDEVRRMSADLIRVRLAEVEGPVVVTGDFNQAAGDAAAFDVLTGDGGFRDAWTDADARGELVSSFNGWLPPDPAGVRIDWVLARGPVRVEHVRIDHDEPSTWEASDHFPVVARLVVGTD